MFLGDCMIKVKTLLFRQVLEKTIYILIMLIILVPIFISMFWAIGKSRQRLEQLQRYWDVQIGMPEYIMLDIMGDGYNRSLLKNNRVKYEWRINASSYGSSYKGISTRSYSGVKKVTIYCKDGYVEEIKPYNV